jgi:Tol biopolymer transport system component
LHLSEKQAIFLENVSTAPIDVEAAHRQLERVLASAGFVRNERMSRFLRFLVERNLEGSANQLKESVIAVEVFGRKPDHDPARDSIVRTEAGRLRARLAEYYLAEGKDDQIVIELPKGGYNPMFRWLGPVTPAALHEKRTGWRVGLWSAVLAVALAAGAVAWFQRTERFWRSPIADARIRIVTDFDGTEQQAAVSRDGKFVAFLSGRDGTTDVWVTQPGSGQFHNLTQGSVPELTNPSVRTLGFSPDGSLVTFWVRKPAGPGWQIGIWAVPTLGGEPKHYLDGAAEYDWSSDGSRLAFHTPAAGDPLFVSDGTPDTQARPIFAAPPGQHSHFPVWAPDQRFIYFVVGSLPDKLDIWRIRPSGGVPERITSHHRRVTHPVLLNRRTLMYLASDPDGSGPWLYSMDVERRIPHRLTFGPDAYTSLAATADGKRLVLTRANPKRTLWQLRVGDSHAESSVPVRIPTTPASAFSPRLAPDYLIYVSSAAGNQSIWKRANGADKELWSGNETEIIGGPAISPDGGRIAFSARKSGHSLLYVMRADGTDAHVVVGSLELQGSPAWAPDGRSLTAAANSGGVPHLFQVLLDNGRATVLLHDYSVDPAWQPDGRIVVYSGPDIGTAFFVKAVTPQGIAQPLPRSINLTRGARHLKFLAGKNGLAFMQGGIEHKDVWLMDPQSGAERQLTHLAADFNMQDFDISGDGREVVVERVEERSDIVLLDLAR